MQYELPPQQLVQHHDPSQYTHNLYVPHNARIKSEHGSDRGVSPHGSDSASRFSSNGSSLHHSFQSSLNGLANGIRYHSPQQLNQQVPMIQHSYHADQDDGYTHQLQQALPQQQDHTPSEGTLSNGLGSLPKAFVCNTCTKGFARRSDLARHERIHSGIRPHVCEHPGCGKQFIQRSALTVHSRVHTGEKPHMCERCGKPFSDSSSLARHRRIHSGKRPYKCPYADCQKTFTRRTTLTRHQNHHTGTIEEARAATAAVLATHVSSQPSGSRSDGEDFVDEKSPMGTPSHHDRTNSVSPATLSGSVPNLQRHQADYFMSSMNGNMSMPPHMRPEMSNHSPRSVSPSNSQAYLPVNGSRHASMTSHPNSYPLPNTLEPPAANGSQNGSVTGSPNLPGAGWGSPGPQSLSGGHQADYSYPDPNTHQFVQNAQNMYYHNPTMQPGQRLSQDIWGHHA